ncbi:hypothetical protein AT705_09915 [Pseudoalteromonas rubra]|uniref:Integrase catalytic domain-containing protein n=1 Tax=Pseudoalteromonas rubra TaxID=43658 RepID=A0A0U3IIW3_9GAMM|nr:hypothetical protein AT705_09915 [Pseudoalteromonas rubra]
MRLLAILILYPKPKTKVPDKAHRVSPYLLREAEVTYANQMWTPDISYIPMVKRVVYVVTVIDRFRGSYRTRLIRIFASKHCMKRCNFTLNHRYLTQIWNDSLLAMYLQAD